MNNSYINNQPFFHNQEQKKSNTKIIIGVILTVIILAIVSFFLFFNNKKESNDIKLNTSRLYMKTGNEFILVGSYINDEGFSSLLIYESEDPTIATVEKRTGVITALKEGKTRIKVYVETSPDKYSYCEIIIRDKSNIDKFGNIVEESNEQLNDNDTPNDIVNNNEQNSENNNKESTKPANYTENDINNMSDYNQIIAVSVGEKITNKIEKSNEVVSWDVSDSSVATVDTNGEIVGKKAGTVTVVGKDKNGSETVKVSINVRKDKSIQDVDFLKTEGTKFVKVGSGNTVLLRGFNLGEWLSRAISLSPVTNVSKIGTAEKPFNREYADNNAQINYVIKKRFPNRYNELNDAYYDNFITSFDISKLSEMGINVVRIPVEWSYFVSFTFFPEQERYTYQMLTGQDLESRLKRLDWIVSECRKYGIYVIFDLHVVDGGQNNGGIRNDKGGYTFFKRESKVARDNAIEIWRIIASRFKDNPGVAGYELLNEPGPSIGTDEVTVYEEFIKEAYNTIRNVENGCKNKHIIFIEAPMESATVHSLSRLKKPSAYGFTNVAYSVHDYFTNNNSILPGNGTTNDLKNAIKTKVDKDVKEMKEYGVPLYVGETCFLWKDVEEVWSYAMSLYDFNFISYSFWAYKVTDYKSFGLIYYSYEKDNPSIFARLWDDSFNDIKNKFSLNTTTANYTFNEANYYGVIKNHIVSNDSISKISSVEYTCSVGEKIISTIKTYSMDGEAKLSKIAVGNSKIATVTKISPTGPICTGTACQTIEINCLKKGETSFSATSNFGKTTTARIIVK